MSISEKNIKSSVIVSVYKDDTALRLILNSLLKQTVADFEIIVSEDCQSTVIKECVDSFRDAIPGIQHLSQEDIGFRKNIALNRAIRTAHSDHIIFIDGDCVPHPTFVAAHLQYAAEGLACTGRRLELGEKISQKLRDKKADISRLTNRFLYFLNIIPLVLDNAKNIESGIYSKFLHRKTNDNEIRILGCNFSCSKQDLLQINGFNEDYLAPGFGEDSDIDWRLVKAGVRIKNVKFSAIQYHLFHPRTYSASAENMALFERTRQSDNYICQHGLEQIISLVRVLNNHKKQVAIMCFSSGAGGMELDAIKLARMLGKEMEVVLFCKEGEFIHHSHQGVNRDYSLEPVSFSSRIFSLSMLLRVRSLIKQYSFNNVVFFGASELKTLYFSFSGINLNLIVRHGTTKSSPKKDLIHRMIYSCVDIHVALSKHLLRNIKKIVPEHPGVEYKYIPQSFKFTDVHIDRDREHELRIVHVGRVTKGKGQMDAVIACKSLHDNNIKFSIDFLGAVDDEIYHDEIKKITNASSYAKSVSFKGHVENVSEYLANSDLLLFPSFGEGMPNALIEALHYGVVCVTYDNTVFPEFVDMGFSLHLVETGNVTQLGKTLLKVVTHMESEKKMAAANMPLAKRIFRPESELYKWEKILR